MVKFLVSWRHPDGGMSGAYIRFQMHAGCIGILLKALPAGSESFPRQYKIADSKPGLLFFFVDMGLTC